MNALPQHASRIFIATERKLRPLIEAFQPNQSHGNGWRYFVEAQSIHHALFPTWSPPHIQVANNKDRVDKHFIWWLESRTAQQTSAIGQAILSQFPVWQSENLTKLREFLAFALIVSVRFMENVASQASQYWAVPKQTPAAAAFPRTKLTGDYLVDVYDRRDQHPDWHALRFPLSVISTCNATIEHRYPEGVEVRFCHPKGGWVRAIVPSADLPCGAEEGDTVNVSFEHEDDSCAEIGRVKVVAESWKAVGRRPISEFAHLIPELPADLSDAAAMAEYREAMRRAVGEG